jgi:hypothetical protein
MDDGPLFRRTMLALYSHLLSSGVIVVSRPRLLGPGDNLPRFAPVILSLHCGLKELCSWYEEGQALRDISLPLRHLAIVRVDSWNTHQPGLHCLSPLEIPPANDLLNCLIDLNGDQPTLGQCWEFTHKVVSNTRLHWHPDYSSQEVVLSLGQHIHH